MTTPTLAAFRRSISLVPQLLQNINGATIHSSRLVQAFCWFLVFFL